MNTTSLPALLVELGRVGVELAIDPADPGRLRHRPAMIDAVLSAGLANHKRDILRLMRLAATDPYFIHVVLTADPVVQDLITLLDAKVRWTGSKDEPWTTVSEAVNYGQPLPDRTTDADYVLAERLGIAEDLGLSTHIGSPPWLIAVGEALMQIGGAA